MSAKDKTINIQTKFTVFIAIIISLLAMYAGHVLYESYHEIEESTLFRLRDQLAGHLNDVAATQAIERGVGNTIIGGDRSLMPLYFELREKGNAIVQKIDRSIIELDQKGYSNPDFKVMLATWREGYQALRRARSGVEEGKLPSDEWLTIATQNISNEFDLRDLAFTPANPSEAFLYYDTLLRPSIATLGEFAGLERAIIGKIIASGKGITNDALTTLRDHRSRVEQVARQILLLKRNSETSDKLKSAIANFEDNFLGSYQALREEIFWVSTANQNAMEKANQQLIEIGKKYASITKELELDAQKLANSTILNQYLINSDGGKTGDISRLGNILEDIISIRPDYDQIRFLNVNGQEIIRADNVSGHAVIAPEQGLQNKADRYYFIAAKSLKKNQTYISPINLNMEHGKLNIPHKPVLRLASPVFTNGKRRGIVVLNFKADRFLSALPPASYMIDEEGYFLQHPDPEKEWGMMPTLSRRTSNALNEDSSITDAILANPAVTINDKKNMYATRRIHFSTEAQSRYWTLVLPVQKRPYPVNAKEWIQTATSAINSALNISAIVGEQSSAIVENKVTQAQNSILISILFACFAFVVLIFLFINVQHIKKRMKIVFDDLHELAQGKLAQRITFPDQNTFDEIDTLAFGINEMAGSLEVSVTSLKNHQENLSQLIAERTLDLQKSKNALEQEVIERREIQASLEESEERFRSISESSEMAVIVAIDNEGKVIAWNPAAEKVFGYLKSEMMGKPLTIIIPERFRDAHNKGLRRACTTDDYKIIGSTVEVAGLHKNGHEFPIELSLGTWTKDGHKYFSSIIHDISERKKSEETNLRLGRIVENSLNEIFAISYDGSQFLLVNEGARENLGYSASELEEIKPVDICDLYDIAEFETFVRPLVDGRQDQLTIETTHKRKDGTAYDIYINLQLMETETPPIFVAIANDITEQRKLEATLQRSQKLEAVGMLAGGIAHDFNNILGIISGNLTMLLRKANLDEKNKKKVDTALKSAARATDLTKQLLGFTRKNAATVETVNANDVIQSMDALIDQSSSINVTVEMHLAENLWLSDIDPGDLSDALVNISVNAGHAMPDGGTLTIESSNTQLEVLENEASTKLSSKEFVLISLSDTGTGIPSDKLDKIFEPFYTTKDKDKGTGLGLAMVFGFIRRSGGEIRVYSELGVGTTFRLYLPKSFVSDTSPSTSSSTAVQTNLPAGTETILVVDDEQDLAEVAENYLNDAGYNVIVAFSGEDALKMLNTYPEIDLLLTDVVMPGGINGYELAMKTLAMRPLCRIAITSGFTAKAGKSLIEGNLFAKNLSQKILHKPYTETTLLQHIRDTFDEKKMIDWSDSLAVDIAPIDDDHKVLVSLLNQAYALKLDKADDDKINTALHDLAEYASYHFAREEVIMEVSGYPFIDNHKQVHQLLQKRVYEIQNRTNNASSPKEFNDIISFFRNWLVDHIAGMDRPIADYARGKDNKISEALKLHAQDQKG